MLNRMRLVFTGLFLSLALVACSDDNNTATTGSNEAETSTPVTAVEPAPEATTAEGSNDGIQSGMSKEELIKAYGEPDITQDRQLDAMNIEILEWHNDDALITAQLVDGKVTYGRIVPKSE